MQKEGFITITNGGLVYTTDIPSLPELQKYGHVQQNWVQEKQYVHLGEGGKILCFWCRKNAVEEYSQKCEQCSRLPSNVYKHIKWDGNVLTFKGTPFYRYFLLKGIPSHPHPQGEEWNALFHMRAEQTEERLDRLERRLAQLEKTVTEFLDAVDLVPDGEKAQEIIERTKNAFNVAIK
ncbi:MAG: hypothetical protein K2Q45_06605 [Nitrosomonas sp.]|nr:hypothetical protein [Nitrosomonas sp.]